MMPLRQDLLGSGLDQGLASSLVAQIRAHEDLHQGDATVVRSQKPSECTMEMH